jgi:hypothetical protein
MTYSQPKEILGQSERGEKELSKQMERVKGLLK